MCGIAGIFAFDEHSPPVDTAELLRIRDAMKSRGPDGSGLWVSPSRGVGLAHRRLAIIDLSETGAQPMATADGRLTITFNGEIYNYRQLRLELEAKGFAFQSNSDTEVLLHLYADRGRDMVRSLRGMYAFAIWDEREKGLFLARDPFGIKPLYYAERDGQFRFASQVKALLESGKVGTEPDAAGVTGFYIWGFVPEPFTTYREIKALPAGSTMWIGMQNRESPRTFYSLADELSAAAEGPPPDPAQSRALLRDALGDSLRHHLVADVPVGVFLSAGLDSTTITAIAAEASDYQLHSLTLGFHEYRGTENDEALLAERVARQYGTRHQTTWITKADFERDLQGLLAKMDQPSTDGVNTYFVSKAASEAGIKVALSGLGGDELFGGYPSFRHVRMIRRYLAFGRAIPALGRGVRRATAPLIKRFTSPKFASLLEYSGTDSGAYLLRRALFMPWELGEFMDRQMARDGWEELRTIPALEASIAGVKGVHARVAALELQWYMRNQLLRDADWAGMAHSLEIRVPLVDPELLRRVAPLLVSPSPPNKQDFASTPLKPLPQEVLDRQKTGFVVPVREWTLTRSGGRSADRGLRGWARRILPISQRKRVVSLVTDAYGGHGGIAHFNRDLSAAIAGLPEVGQVVVIPRLMSAPSEATPKKITHVLEGLGGKGRYGAAILLELLSTEPVDLIWCAHINLLPLAILAKAISGAPILLCVHGIDAWTPPRNVFARAAVARVDWVASVSELTAERFGDWSGFTRSRITILPNAVHLDWYQPGPKSDLLMRRHGLHGKLVISTFGRLASAERYKGFDQVLDVLPDLVKQLPNLVYLVMGDGTDRARLENRVAALGMQGHVVFTGFVVESQKADYIRLSDTFVMPSRGEGFGIVILEALACGIPVVGSKLDGTREALRDGMLGQLVDPNNPAELREAVLRALAIPTRQVPEGLQHFSYLEFCRRTAALLSRFWPPPEGWTTTTHVQLIHAKRR